MGGDNQQQQQQQQVHGDASYVGGWAAARRGSSAGGSRAGGGLRRAGPPPRRRLDSWVSSSTEASEVRLLAAQLQQGLRQGGGREARGCESQQESWVLGAGCCGTAAC